MICYSCDRCKKSIDAYQEVRYVLRIEVQVAIDDCREELLSDANLEELEELLGDAEPSIGAPANSNKKTFDLCSSCYASYVVNPLGTEAIGADCREN